MHLVSNGAFPLLCLEATSKSVCLILNMFYCTTKSTVSGIKSIQLIKLETWKLQELISVALSFMSLFSEMGLC